jgi:hypothetical protein
VTIGTVAPTLAHFTHLGSAYASRCNIHIPAAVPSSFGEELVAALLCRAPPAPPAAPHSPSKGPVPPDTTTSGPTCAAQHEQQQLVAGRAATALSFLLQHNHAAQMQLLAVQVPTGDSNSSPTGPVELLMARVTRLLQEGTRGSGSGKALPLVYSMLRLCIAWCSGCTAAVSALLLDLSHLPLLADLVGRRVAAGDVHTAGGDRLGPGAWELGFVYLCHAVGSGARSGTACCAKNASSPGCEPAYTSSPLYSMRVQADPMLYHMQYLHLNA